MITKPFLKWAGGKRWLAATIAPLLANGKGYYIEPFLGGGAVFFEVDCQCALLSDVNEELINAYRIVRDQPEQLFHLLTCLPMQLSLFRRIRDEECSSDVARAARMLYLNRGAFNGLYRVNQRGKFNVPFGCKPGTRPADRDAISRCSVKLQKAIVVSMDFRLLLGGATARDTMFLDPPYTVRHDNNGFRRYNERIFRWEDQIVLATMASQSARAGAKIVVTNAAHAEVMSLYPKRLFRRYTISRRTNMAAKSEARGICREAILLSESAASIAEGRNETANLVDLASLARSE